MSKRKNTLSASLGPQLASELGGGSAGANTALVAALPAGQKAVATQAYTASLKDMWIFYVCIAALGLAASLAIGKQKLSKQHEVTKTGLEEQKRQRQERKSEVKAKRESKADGGDSKRASRLSGGGKRSVDDAEKGLGNAEVEAEAETKETSS